MFKTIFTPPSTQVLGNIAICADTHGIIRIDFTDSLPMVNSDSILIDQCQQQLIEYFLGKRKIFDIPLSIFGTNFQKNAWQALVRIPYGETRSYKQQAEQTGSINNCRAVGSANSKNPISIVVPCHRVIGSQGKLTGYAGGLERKQWLLEHEQCFSA